MHEEGNTGKSLSGASIAQPSSFLCPVLYPGSAAWPAPFYVKYIHLTKIALKAYQWLARLEPKDFQRAFSKLVAFSESYVLQCLQIKLH